MSVARLVLIERLREEVAPVSSEPAWDQYDRAVRDAVADYSRRRPNTKLYELSIVSGTATYTLPVDFLKVITLESLWSPDNVLVSDVGLVPVSATYEERHYIVNGEITLDPEPTYTTTRDLWYAAGHVLNSSDAYPDMTEEDAGMVLLKARAIALGMMAAAMASDILSYQVGDVRIEKGKTVEALREGAKALDEEYRERVAAAIGAVGLRGRYNWAGR